MKPRITNRQGFTLIELLLYLAIASVILLSVSVFLSLILQSRVKNQTIAEVEQQGLEAMHAITQTIRNSSSVTVPIVGGSSVTLILAVPLPEKSPTVFDLSGGALRIIEGANGAVVLTNNRVTISNLSFTNLSSTSSKDIIRVQFILKHLNPGSRNEYDYQKKFYGSAERR
ncbi:MAG: prepilin-type N-terminal cleavage/methylation domain-containing protein [Patescibacteria group bacterium]|jgi:prepilin-type N-terminal cleavage/methylation domain-containing protein